MFEDQSANTPLPPKNLPTGPEDIFQGVEKAADIPSGATEGLPEAPNALDAGLLKKKIPVQTPPAEMVGIFKEEGQPFSAIKGPIVGKILLVAGVAALAVGLGFGGWWVYGKYLRPSQGGVTGPENKLIGASPSPVSPAKEQVTTSPVVNPSEVSVSAPGEAATANVPAKMSTDKILFGEQIDSDKDGLDDVREEEIGTGLRNPDTDSDGLSDGDEVLIWKTDPLNPDTDADGYADGQEVRSGYNPLGSGKLFMAPAVTTTTVKSATSAF